MKNGDLVHMPGETVREGESPRLGIVIDDVPQYRTWSTKGEGRIGVLWAGSDGTIDYEPKAWLEVVA